MGEKWKTLITRAEKLLGGPSPFINLSSLLTSEVEFLASRARRLAATIDHPFFSAVRACFQGRSKKYTFLPSSLKSSEFEERGNAKQRAPGGLIILLTGQCCAGTRDKCSVKLSNYHRKMAEIFETVHLAVTVHKSLVDPMSLDSPTTYNQAANDASGRLLVKDLEAGNKVATLVGDILLASVSTSLADFHNSQVVDIISESIGNMFEAEFLPFAANFSHSLLNEASKECPLPSSSNLSARDAADQWLDYISLSHGSLLGSCCQATALLAESLHTRQNTVNPTSRLIYGIGYNYAMLLRLLEEREFVQHVWINRNKYNPCPSVFNKRQRCSLLNYINNGLPEPTLVDALLTSQLPIEVLQDQSARVASDMFVKHVAQIFEEYDRLGEKLSQNLSQTFDEFRSLSRHNKERATSSAVTVLGEMIREMTNEASTSTNLCYGCIL